MAAPPSNPTMTITRNSSTSQPSINATTTLKTFTGGPVYIDLVVPSATTAQAFGVVNVNFPPAARTYWHTHEKGQLLTVTAGQGWVCDFGGEPQRIGVGDVVWCPPGTKHWHGADEGHYMVHQAISFGKVEWGDPVGEEEYARTKGR